jgi:hypothetical protein
MAMLLFMTHPHDRLSKAQGNDVVCHALFTTAHSKEK